MFTLGLTWEILPFHLKLSKTLDLLRGSCYKVRVKNPLDQSWAGLGGPWDTSWFPSTASHRSSRSVSSNIHGLCFQEGWGLSRLLSPMLPQAEGSAAQVWRQKHRHTHTHTHRLHTQLLPSSQILSSMRWPLKPSMLQRNRHLSLIHTCILPPSHPTLPPNQANTLLGRWKLVMAIKFKPWECRSDEKQQHS